MTDIRGKRAKLNIGISFLSQLISLACGLVLPGLLINAFGSEAYGATASITQFLAYITLLEGGIGGVARAALYKPLAEGNMDKVSAVLQELRRFFRTVALVFGVYVLVLACGFRTISGTEALDWVTSCLLVIVISISTFAQYFIGITNAVLLQASHKTYITQAITTGTVVMNAGLTILLVHLECNLIVVKLVSSCVFVLRPVAQWWYVRRNYQITPKAPRDKSLLKQKWEGLGQHIAFFLHSNTAVAVLTLLADLKQVAVYSVYNMVVAHMQSLTVAFASGMEAVFGDMLAKKENKELQESFSGYETLLSFVSVVAFSVTAVMILPFVKIYTAGVTDANYIEPVFSVLLPLSSMVYCIRQPYHAITIAAGRFKETRPAAYGEVALNVGLSVLLVGQFGLLGVAIGTLAATTFRMIYYAIYLSRHILYRNILLFVKRMLVNSVGFVGVFFVGKLLTSRISTENYLQWVLCAAVVGVAALVIVGVLQLVFYRKDVQKLLKKK